MWGVGCRVYGVGCGVQGVGCRVQGVGCRGIGCRVQGAGITRKEDVEDQAEDARRLLHRGHLHDTSMTHL